MGLLGSLFFPWGLILQGLAILHFIRRRPDTYWLYIILFLGPIGALIYLFAEAAPDVNLLQGAFKAFPRRKRIADLEIMVKDNPSAGNWEELGDLLMEEGRLIQAREAFDRAIAAHIHTDDPYYRRGVCSLDLNEPALAIPDLERVVANEPTYDYSRAAGLLAHAYALTGDKPRAEALFRHVVERSTSSETYLNFAALLAAEGNNTEAREWTQKVLDKKPTLPGYLRRRERPNFRRASKLLKQIPA
jgi:hypothetical protein